MKLAQRRDPYWTVISKGCAIGYRRGAKGGTWIARMRDDEGKQHFDALGAADDVRDPDGITALSFAEAQERARAFFIRKAREFAGTPIRNEASGGTRDQLNMHLQQSYRVAFYYNLDLEKYAEFQSHPYFSDIRQKPHVGNIMLSVLKFTMRAKRNKQRLNRLYKRAPVLEYLRTQDVLPEAVAEYLKNEGGVDYSYERLNAAKKLRRRKMFADEYHMDRDLAEIVSARSKDDDDDCAMSVESAAADHDPATASSDQRKVHEVSRERNNPLDNGLAFPDARRALIVEMDPLDLKQVRDSVGGIIHFTVGPTCESDWWRVRGEIVSLERRDGQSSPPSREVVAPLDTT